eukprot:1847475-Rhodomonas_salina.1
MGIKCGRMVPRHSPPLERCVRFLIPLISVIVCVLAEPTRHTRRSGMGDTCRRLAQGGIAAIILHIRYAVSDTDALCDAVRPSQRDDFENRSQRLSPRLAPCAFALQWPGLT